MIPKNKYLPSQSDIEYIRELFSSGETLKKVSSIMGVSRHTMKRVMADNDIAQRRSLDLDQVKEVADKIKYGMTFKDAAEYLNIKKDHIRAALMKAGIDPDELKKLRTMHRYDGAVFGNWSVVPGTGRRTPSGHTLTCSCVCGVLQSVSLTNLIGGASQSCGCEGYDDRVSYKWRCKETGKVVESSIALSRLVNVNRLKLYRCIHKNRDFTDDSGNTWQCLKDNPQPAQSVGREQMLGIHWVNRDSGQMVISTAALSRITGDLRQKLVYRSSTGQPYVDPSGNTWVSIG